MGFLANFNVYVLRNSINVAIVAMVNSTEETALEEEIANETAYECPDRGMSLSPLPENVCSIIMIKLTEIK